LPLNCLQTLYYSLIHSHLSYGILIWGNANKSILKQTTILQKRAIRTIHNAKFNSHTDPLYRASNILKIGDMFEYNSVLFVFDFINNKLPISFNNLFKFNKDIPSARLTRQSEMLYITRCTSQFAGRLPLFVLPIIWNNWTKCIDQNGTRSNCKRQIKIKLLDKYPTRVKCNNIHCTECHN